MGFVPVASPGFAQGHRSISPSSKKYEEFSWHEEVAFCVPYEIVLGSLWLLHSLRLSSIFSPAIFFSGYEYDAAVQFTLETLQTLVQPQGLVVQPLLWLHSQITRKLISSSSKNRTYMYFIHSLHFRSSQGQNRRKYNIPGRLGLMPLRDGVYMMLLKPVH